MGQRESMICTSPSSPRLQLVNMGLTEVPSELFRMNNVKAVFLAGNKLCSLPSAIWHLKALYGLDVGLLKRSGAI
jgi:Leucine-rich repeat (LRR) protein